MKLKSCFDFIRIFIAITLLSYLIYSVGITKLLEALQSLPFWIIFLVLFFIFSGMTFAYLHWLCMIRAFPIKISNWQLLINYVNVFFLSMTLPSRAGDFSFFYYFKKRGIAFRDILRLFVLDKAILFAVMFILVAITASIYFPEQKFFFWAQIFFLIGLVFVTLFLPRLTSLYDIRSYFSKWVYLSFALNILKWLFKALAYWLVFLGLAHGIPYSLALFISVIEVLITIVPISVYGLGLKEGASIYLLERFGGVPNEVSLSVYMVFLMLTYTTVACCWIIINKSEKPDKSDMGGDSEL